MLSVDVVVDIQAGDCGKGKVTNWLIEDNHYDGVMRYNGGGNAGHTIYIDDKKIVTHQVPCGVLHDVVSIIGPECVVNLEELEKELQMLEGFGYKPRDLLYVDHRAHVITSKHLALDGQDQKIGTTRKGIGPAYADKASRTGLRISDYPDLPFRVGDIYDMFFVNPASYFEWYAKTTASSPRILAEGAQGYQLDINFGRYPFVTSSHCTTGAVCLNGIPPKSIGFVYGVMKAYQTYVGNDETWAKSKDPALKKIQKAGNEFGATTGRERKVDWLDLDAIIPACRINGVDTIIINKLDVLEKVGKFGVYAGGMNFFSNRKNFTDFVESYIKENYGTKTTIIWSRSATTV